MSKRIEETAKELNKVADDLQKKSIEKTPNQLQEIASRIRTEANNLRIENSILRTKDAKMMAKYMTETMQPISDIVIEDVERIASEENLKRDAKRFLPDKMAKELVRKQLANERMGY